MTDPDHPEYLPQQDWDAVESEVERLAAARRDQEHGATERLKEDRGADPS